MTQALERVRLWATTLTAMVAAASSLAGIYYLVGLLATVAVVSALLMLLLMLGLQQAIKEARSIRRSIDIMNYELIPNGKEYRLPHDLQGRPLREIVGEVASVQRTHTDRLKKGDDWMESHLELHKQNGGT